MAAKKTKQKTTTRAAEERVSRFHRQLTFSFIGLSVLLVLLIIYFAISQVTIFITPHTSLLTATFDIDAMESVDTTLAGTNFIPATINTETIEQSRTIQLTDGTQVPDIARGEVTVYNNYSQDQPLVATTRLLTPDGKLFRLEEYILVPAGGSVTTTAYSDETGATYDIAPTRFTIPGLWEGLQDQIYAESNKHFTGGVRLEKKVQQEQIDQAAAELLVAAKAELSQLHSSEDGIARLITLGQASWTSDIDAGETAESFTITATIPVTTVRYQTADLESVVINNLIAQTPTNQQFVSAHFDTLQATINSIDTTDGHAILTVTVQGKSIERIPTDKIDISALQGKTKKEVVEYLLAQPEIQEVKAQFIPGWLRTVPPLKDHVFIQVVK